MCDWVRDDGKYIEVIFAMDDPLQSSHADDPQDDFAIVDVRLTFLKNGKDIEVIDVNDDVNDVRLNGVLKIDVIDVIDVNDDVRFCSSLFSGLSLVSCPLWARVVVCLSLCSRRCAAALF